MLVASSVTDSTQAGLRKFALTLAPSQVETLQIAVSRGDYDETGIDYRARRPVTLFKFARNGAGS